MKKIFVLLTLMMLYINGFSQDFTGNVTSNFIWRGKMLCNKISVQPIIYLNHGDSICSNEIGTFSSFSLDGSYAEVDLYYKLTYKKIFVSVTNYMFDINKPFDYNKHTTSNAIEPAIGVYLFNLCLSFNTFVYGADKDSLGNQYNSSYVEACYYFKYFNLFCGITPYKSIYANSFAIVNTGIALTKKISIDKFVLPISTVLMVNPTSKQIFVNLTFAF
jgi:hypothetical protein